MSAWFALVESNTSGTGRLFARAASALGHRPVLLCAEPARYPYATADALDVRVLNTNDAEAVERACRQLASVGGLAGVLSSSEYFLAVAARAARRLGLPGADPDALCRCRDKETQRELMAAAGLPAPGFRAVATATEAVRAANQLGGRVVLKPVDGSGSVGVRICSDPREVAEHSALLLKRTVNERGISVCARILVEEFVEGPEYSVEVFDGTAVGVIRKHVSEPPFALEEGHDYPAPVSPLEASDLATVAVAACRVLGVDWGAAHVELKMTPRGPFLIEVNPRLPGGFIPRLVELAGGGDLIGWQVARAAGLPSALSPQPLRPVSLRFLLPPASGRLASVSGIDRACQVPGVVEIDVYRGEGEQIRRQGDFRDRVGHVIARASTATAATAAAETARDLVRLAVDATSPDRAGPNRPPRETVSKRSVPPPDTEHLQENSHDRHLD